MKTPLRPDLQWESKFGYPSLHVVGVDEVGRGCLAGPVMAAAVILPDLRGNGLRPAANSSLPDWTSEITDSKKLTPEKRERLAPQIESLAIAWAVGEASVQEIDEINIYWASHLAMRRAIEGVVEKLREAKLAPISHILVDGNVIPQGLPAAATAIVGGDLKCLSIAAGSILAKVRRDRLMAEMDSVYPGYGFAGHKGYSTPVHSEALRAQGACEIHRRSFAPVAAVLNSFET